MWQQNPQQCGYNLVPQTELRFKETAGLTKAPQTWPADIPTALRHPPRRGARSASWLWHQAPSFLRISLCLVLPSLEIHPEVAPVSSRTKKRTRQRRLHQDLRDTGHYPDGALTGEPRGPVGGPSAFLSHVSFMYTPQ